MTPREVIDQLLAVRVRIDRPQPFYYAYFPRVIDFFCDGRLPSPELIITFSSSRQTEFVALGDTSCLVYDQYLGQSVNHLNRVVGVGSLDHLLAVYTDKVLAEEFRLRGDRERSLYFAYRYLTSKSGARECINSGEDDAAKRSRYIIAQELYILLHELSHRVIDVNRQQFAPALDGNERYIRESTYFSIINSVDSAEGARESLDSNERSQLGYLDFIADTVSREQFWLPDEATVRRLAVEMTCDDLSTAMTTSLVTAQFEIEPQLVFEALWLGQLYLWWLRTIQYFARTFSQLPVPGEESLMEGPSFDPGQLPGSTLGTSVILHKLRHNKLEYRSYENSVSLREELTSASVPEPSTLFRMYAEMRDSYFDPFVDALTSTRHTLSRTLIPLFVEAQILNYAEKASCPVPGPSKEDWVEFVDAVTGWKPSQVEQD